jgi:hypothetical protein
LVAGNKRDGGANAWDSGKRLDGATESSGSVATVSGRHDDGPGKNKEAEGEPERLLMEIAQRSSKMNPSKTNSLGARGALRIRKMEGSRKGMEASKRATESKEGGS